MGSAANALHVPAVGLAVAQRCRPHEQPRGARRACTTRGEASGFFAAVGGVGEHEDGEHGRPGREAQADWARHSRQWMKNCDRLVCLVCHAQNGWCKLVVSHSNIPIVLPNVQP